MTVVQRFNWVLRDMLEKPAYGQPCNACGRCCQDELCGLAKKVFGPRPGPCPALAEVESGFGCGLILTPSRFAPAAASVHGADAAGAAAALLCAAGAGCDAQGHDELVDEAVRARVMDVTRSRPQAEIERARAIWREAWLPESAEPFIR
jgi:hypothetical protein